MLRSAARKSDGGCLSAPAGCSCSCCPQCPGPVLQAAACNTRSNTKNREPAQSCVNILGSITHQHTLGVFGACLTSACTTNMAPVAQLPCMPVYVVLPAVMAVRANMQFSNDKNAAAAAAG